MKMQEVDIVIVVHAEYPDGAAEPDPYAVGRRVSGLANGAMSTEPGEDWRLTGAEFSAGTAWRAS